MMPGRIMRLIAAAGVFTLAAVLTAAQADADPAAVTSLARSVSGLNVLDTMACPTSASCVSTGANSDLDGKSAVITAATGAVKIWPGKLTTADPSALSCPPSAKNCLFVADNAVGTVAISTGAMKITATPISPSGGIVALSALSCPKTCYAVGFEGPMVGETNAVLLHLSSAGKILSSTKDTGSGSGAIACPTASLCFMTDYAKPTTSIQVVSNGHIGASHAFPADTYVQGMSCFGSSVCYALGGNNTSSPELTDELFPLNPKTGAIGTEITIGGDFSGSTYNGGLNCINATTCLVAGYTDSSSETAALVTVTSGTPGSPVDYAGQYMEAVACASASKCYGVGGDSGSAFVDKVKG
jgi:hypothetical protein